MGVVRATQEDVMEALKDVYDPELGLNIVDLGLIYNVDFSEDGKKIHIDMTMTAIGCPLYDELEEQVRSALLLLPGVEEVEVALVWDPPWTPDRMSEEAKAMLRYW
ncbi:MAG: metal-sulfur cluster assembly factor [Firmicutes bacterium]|nr:metal-sulfur cluster assembly factor [Bacillota bacterium]